jgi:hypothetical protein
MDGPNRSIAVLEYLMSARPDLDFTKDPSDQPSQGRCRRNANFFYKKGFEKWKFTIVLLIY